MAAYDDAIDAARALHQNRTDPERWYAGVTNDPERRLGPSEHNVDPASGDYVIVECTDLDVALEAEDVLHDWGYLGGGSSAATEESVYVYVYRITRDTCEDC